MSFEAHISCRVISWNLTIAPQFVVYYVTPGFQSLKMQFCGSKAAKFATKGYQINAP